MNDLITITHANIGGATLPTVGARYLHGRLEVQTDFRHWFPRRTDQCDLKIGNDFAVSDNFDRNPLGGRPTQDYQLTLQAAVKIALVEGTEPAKRFLDQASAYLANGLAQAAAPVPLSREQRLAKNLAESRELLLEYQAENAALIEDNRAKKEVIEVQAAKMAEDAPMVGFAEAVMAGVGDIELGELAMILQRAGVDLGRNRLMAELRNDGFLGKTTRLNLPTQKSVGLLREIERPQIDRDGKPVFVWKDGRRVQRIDKVSMVTPEGQGFFVEYFKRRTGITLPPTLLN